MLACQACIGARASIVWRVTREACARYGEWFTERMMCFFLCCVRNEERYSSDLHSSSLLTYCGDIGGIVGRWIVQQTIFSHWNEP